VSETGTPRILIVDDEPANIRTLGGLLGEEYTLHFATGGEEALAIAAREVPDLILLDIRMPGMDGYEVSRRLSQEPQTSDIPVIFVTALDEEADEAKGLEMGGVDYITKPLRGPIVKARVANHVRLKQYRDQLQALSRLDGLTGVANRRQFDEALAREWGRAQRNGTPLSLILADVDHFKAYNDNYGHLAGDEVLKQVAATLEGTLYRPSDRLARYGGEEFIALLPDTDLDGACELARRMGEAVAELGLPHAYSEAAGHVTVSLGMATTYPAQDTAPESLCRAADHHLYAAKQAGRNQACCHRRPDALAD
jgi:diguanylate cyclase (GGDEF)-like protein